MAELNRGVGRPPGILLGVAQSLLGGAADAPEQEALSRICEQAFVSGKA